MPQDAQAAMAVPATTGIPKGTPNPVVRTSDVWVVSSQALHPKAETLRVIQLESQKLQVASSGQAAEKVEQLCRSLSSPGFSQRVRTIQADLNSEKQAMTKIWAKRQAQIDRVAKSMLTVVGELPAISQNSLPKPDVIEALALTTNMTEGDEE